MGMVAVGGKAFEAIPTFINLIDTKTKPIVLLHFKDYLA